MRIESVELRRVQIPLRRAFKHALSERQHTDAVFVTIRDDAGEIGWGEILPRSYVTGETVEHVLEVSAPKLAATLVGCEFTSLTETTVWLERVAEDAGRELAVVCGFDLALLDVASRRFDQPIADLLGTPGENLPAGVIIGFEHPTKTLARYCATLRLAGKRHIKVKVGLEDDLERLAAVGSVFGDLPLRLDANAAWSADQAIEWLVAMAKVAPIASIEQPIASNDLDGLRRIREATGVAVMADESVCSLDDAREIIEAKAADIFNVRLGKNGGLWASRRLAKLGSEAGVGLHLGTMVGESGVLSRASELFGRCVSGFACLDGKGQNAFLLAVDILADQGEYAAKSANDGLGVMVDIARLAAHQVGPAQRITPNGTEIT